MVAMIGRLVRDERTRRGWTQQSLAERAGIGVRTLRDVEQGRAGRLRPASSARLAAALDLSITDLDPAPTLWIGVLGPLIVRAGRTSLDVGPNKQRSLLGLLALRPGEAVGRHEIVDVLWGERPPASSRRLIQTYVARLRKVLEPHSQRAAILTSRTGYQLSIPAEQLDLLSFTGHGSDRAGLASALDLWRGPVLADLPAELWGLEEEFFPDHPNDKFARIPNEATTLCLDAFDQVDPHHVYTNPCIPNSRPQAWAIWPDGHLQNLQTGWCLDGGFHDLVYMNPCQNDNAFQKWEALV